MSLQSLVWVGIIPCGDEMKEKDIRRINQAPETEPERQYYFMELAERASGREKKRQQGRLTFTVVTFGCQMNARDSEKLEGILERVGYEKSEEEQADFVIYNTCTVRENANLRVYGRLGNLNRIKRKIHR